MADIMGTDGAAWYRWNKHGKCAGLSTEVYFETARLAYAHVNRPPLFREPDKPVKAPARVIEEAFLKANPDWPPDMLSIACKASASKRRACA